MGQQIKKSLEWLKPLHLNAAETRQFTASISKKPGVVVLKKQQALFDAAKKLRQR
ncbi:MAG: hypothetical protein Q8P95_03040 [bacterium]|nr:hypothetical protein [bacterium]